MLSGSETMYKPSLRAVQLAVDEIKKIACHFFDSAQVSAMTVTPAETGLSGSQTYILEHLQTGRRHVLKQLPRDRSIDQIRWTQSLADFVRSYGNTLLPIALNHHGRSKRLLYAPSKIAAHSDGTTWQCLVYIEGLPCKTPGSPHISLAIEALANFHKKASMFRMAPYQNLSGWQRRVLQLRSLVKPRREQRVNSTITGATLTKLHGLYKEFSEILRAAKTRETIQNTLSYTMHDVHQPVLRDCRWNHVLFSDSFDRVTGMIDIDAAGWDDPAVDISRLLGSWHLERPQSEERLVDLWPDAFQQYKRITDARPNFPSRVQVLHDTAIICGIDRWFTWLFLEMRNFPDMEQVLQRISLLLHATPAAIRRLEHIPAHSDSI